MNRLALLLCLLLPGAAAWSADGEVPAGEKTISLSCFQRRPYLELSMKWDEAGGFKLSLLAPEGADSLPLFYGAVTSYNLGYLRQQKENLRDWPALVSLYWEPGRCRRSGTDPWLAECGGPAQSQAVNGAPAWPYSTSTFMAYRQRQAGVDREFDSRRMTWAVETQGSTYFLGFNFMTDMCVQSGGNLPGKLF